MAESTSDASLARQLGKRLRLARLRQHKQQTVVAGLAGITTDYLYQIERGPKLPSPTVLMELALVLDVPLSALLGETSAAGHTSSATAPREVAPPANVGTFDAVPLPGSVPVGERLYAAMISQPPGTTT